MSQPDSLAISDAPPGRRFRFGLRTMFVLVTVFAAWLGYEVHWLRSRREFVAYEEAIRDSQTNYWATITRTGKPGQSPPWAPGFLWLFGEPGYRAVGFHAESPTMGELTDTDRERLTRARQLFPEATISTIHVWETPEEHGVGSVQHPLP